MRELEVFQGLLARLIENHPLVGRGSIHDFQASLRDMRGTARDRLCLILFIGQECCLEDLVWLPLLRLTRWQLVEMLGVRVLPRVGVCLLGMGRRDRWAVVLVIIVSVFLVHGNILIRSVRIVSTPVNLLSRLRSRDLDS